MCAAVFFTYAIFYSYKYINIHVHIGRMVSYVMHTFGAYCSVRKQSIDSEEERNVLAMNQTKRCIRRVSLPLFVRLVVV